MMIDMYVKHVNKYSRVIEMTYRVEIYFCCIRKQSLITENY